MLRLDSMTPLGNPVVPDVYCMLMTSSIPMLRPMSSSSASLTFPASARMFAYGVNPGGVSCPMKMRRSSVGIFPAVAPISTSAST